MTTSSLPWIAPPSAQLHATTPAMSTGNAKTSIFTPEFISTFQAGYTQWQQRNLEAAFQALQNEYCPKSQSEMASAWRQLDDHQRSQLYNTAIKTFMREAYASVKLLSVPSVYAELVKVFDHEVWEATAKEDWL